MSTDNRVLMFGVNLDTATVAKGTDYHTAIIKAIGTNSPGDYSITRLIMDFSSTSFSLYIAIPDLISLQPLKWIISGTFHSCMLRADELRADLTDGTFASFPAPPSPQISKRALAIFSGCGSPMLLNRTRERLVTHGQLRIHKMTTPMLLRFLLRTKCSRPILTLQPPPATVYRGSM